MTHFCFLYRSFLALLREGRHYGHVQMGKILYTVKKFHNNFQIWFFATESMLLNFLAILCTKYIAYEAIDESDILIVCARTIGTKWF